MKTRRSFLLLLAVLVPFLLGCGGSGGGVPTGRAIIRVEWPTSRLVPFASTSIRLVVTQGGQTVGEATLARPSGGGSATATLERLPIGSVVVAATAYPEANAGGTAQAGGIANATIVKGAVASVSLTMASTITEATISPVAATVAVGASTKLTASFRNAQSQVVIVALATQQWTSRNPSIATVDSRGLVMGVSAGRAVIEAKDTESGKSNLAEVTVTGSSGAGGGGGGGGDGGTITLNPANGHYYQAVAVPAGISWTDAKAAAEARGGYLATLTTQAENDFVFGLTDAVAYWQLGTGYSPVPNLGPWLGGYRASPAINDWHWVTGEPWSYSRWHSNQPDSGIEEDKLHYLVQPNNGSRQSLWNNLTDNGSPRNLANPIAYVIEWNTNPGG